MGLQRWTVLFVFLLVTGCTNVTTNQSGIPVMVSFVDAATEDPIRSTVTVRVEGSGKDLVRDSKGGITNVLTATGGSLTFQLSSSASLSPEAPVELVLVIDAEGFVSTSLTQRLTSPTPDVIVLRLVNMATPPRGITVTTNSSAMADTTGRIVVGAQIATNPDPQTGATANVTIPTDITVTDLNGEPLSGTLNTQMIYYSPRELESIMAYPGGVSVRVSGNPSGVSNGYFKSAGMVMVELRDSSNRVGRNFSGAGLEVAIDVPAATLDPILNKIVTNGDRIPLWSSDTQTGEWTYEGEASAVSPLNGDPKTTFTFRARHLTMYNLDWLIDDCALSRKIHIVNGVLQPIDETTAQTLSFRVLIKNTMGKYDGLVHNFAANKDYETTYNVVQFKGAPRTNGLNIITLNSVGQALADQHFNTAAGNGLCDVSNLDPLYIVVNI